MEVSTIDMCLSCLLLLAILLTVATNIVLAIVLHREIKEERRQRLNAIADIKPTNKTSDEDTKRMS